MTKTGVQKTSLSELLNATYASTQQVATSIASESTARTAAIATAIAPMLPTALQVTQTAKDGTPSTSTDTGYTFQGGATEHNVEMFFYYRGNRIDSFSVDCVMNTGPVTISYLDNKNSFITGDIEDATDYSAITELDTVLDVNFARTWKIPVGFKLGRPNTSPSGSYNMDATVKITSFNSIGACGTPNHNPKTFILTKNAVFVIN